jgi:hypothetical protein
MADGSMLKTLNQKEREIGHGSCVYNYTQVQVRVMLDDGASRMLHRHHLTNKTAG